MKMWGFLLVVFIGLTFVNLDSFFEPDVKIQKKIGDSSSTNDYKKEIEEEQIYQGNLLLVNDQYPVHPQSVKSDIINLSEAYEGTRDYTVLNRDTLLSEAVEREFSKMIAAAKKEGVRNFSITSGFRGFDEQSMLYQEMGSDYALPAGYSEHNVGLSLDVGSTQIKMAHAPEGKWIEENAWKYGFILRYPKDKTDITGIQYEPWHIRYVGLPHSAIMKEKNHVLEEYLEYLKEEKQISAEIDGETYTITYYPLSKTGTINVPEDRQYEISGNNMDGVIVTVTG
ncbi:MULTISPECIES: VanY-A/VanY-F/VanY-M family D-Ala-D-Ala carboxypeptidase [unclassified Cytobacillus]|uniref:VanY-A/VanY-F/VanY-M family D-Ala-D-Ala carboxypeptidase n=1 Tax=unclassified Cytobacillus TaxID=2675268 RepID=UPI00203DB277|nr:VanY-A/VanY-F/VanY-M family D-Ala-D-Ala carboxypeptidase [Cytobacillus sp. AMY 15.2]MCM3093004.1 VanY-A/VanY-F/VanY-M family D-Ala-D-Ala carboxypeptidase [Cytobacillus sp. AMY 15.2]